ncbi:MAG: hypothetical protein Q8R72_12280 [Hylemonella sp.]|nr:hypothetical protein [Hylemonella sp.]
MPPLRAVLLALAVFTVTAGAASAQSLSISPYSLGQAESQSGGWALRSDYSPGLKWTGPEGLRPESEGNRAGLYADWFPFASSGFRLVGGLSFGEAPASLPSNGMGSGSNWANWGSSPYQLRPKSPTRSTYLGIGYSQHGLASKGLGFYADMGVALGALSGDTEANAGSSASNGLDGWRTQSNGMLGFRYLPSVSLGLIYRY